MAGLGNGLLCICLVLSITSEYYIVFQYVHNFPVLLPFWITNLKHEDSGCKCLFVSDSKFTWKHFPCCFSKHKTCILMGEKILYQFLLLCAKIQKWQCSSGVRIGGCTIGRCCMSWIDEYSSSISIGPPRIAISREAWQTGWISRSCVVWSCWLIGIGGWLYATIIFCVGIAQPAPVWIIVKLAPSAA